MSPTEDELRAALHDGEGESVSADRSIALGRARKARRRTQLLGGAATVVFVGALATGGALLSGDNGQSNASSSKEADTVHGAKAGSTQDPALRRVTPTSSVPDCPSAPTHQLLPGGGSPGQFGSDGKLFAKPVASLIVCGYTQGPQESSSGPTSERVSGDDARGIVASLEGAPNSRPVSTNCPDYEPAIQRTLVLLATATDGSHERAVTATISGPACRNQVTNGTAVRYDWSPPRSFLPTLQKLTPVVGGTSPEDTTTGGGNRKHGSPIHS